MSLDNIKLILEHMNQSNTILDHSHFGKLLGDDIKRTDMKKESLYEVTREGIKCPNVLKEGTYHCQICNRLRKVCPSSNKSHQESTFVKEETSRFGHQSFGNFGNSSSALNNTTFIKPSSHTNIRNTATFFTPPPVRQIQRQQPRIIEEIIYVPHIHNILVPQSHPINPEKISNFEISYDSPNYKHRHRSGSTKQPQSSPIKVEDYHDKEILTPEKLKKLTESMIA